jgi:hypothetical protein
MLAAFASMLAAFASMPAIVVLPMVSVVVLMPTLTPVVLYIGVRATPVATMALAPPPPFHIIAVRSGRRQLLP